MKFGTKQTGPSTVVMQGTAEGVPNCYKRCSKSLVELGCHGTYAHLQGLEHDALGLPDTVRHPHLLGLMANRMPGEGDVTSRQ